MVGHLVGNLLYFLSFGPDCIYACVKNYRQAESLLKEREKNLRTGIAQSKEIGKGIPRPQSHPSPNFIPV